ncbi:long-chain-fatty-acid--CoA ligase [Amycolatopsis acidicola]|uniref:Long-chain-fatty-acid--CoA ligase n=1 Tax=Amycolatopsis acidicola TaxID=2596893 RepID=A0A5N0UV90_9PSEU|nr:long-chain-fatty-acid--CoA ligase [Amycolatopsis acidicola]KAA9152673.1 long-chain-fatty-acid--CoA ligase [Amycolatopsis acidicola]
MLLHDIVESAARRQPDRLALRFEDTTLTFTELRDHVRRAAWALQTIAGPGDRVAVLSSTRPEYVELYYGVPAAGLVLVPLNHRLSPAELASIITHSGASVLIVSAEYQDLTDGLRGEIPCVRTIVGLDGGGDVSWAELLAEVSADELPRVDEGSTAWIVYTSGTTGRSKGVMLSHRNLVTGVTGSAIHWDLPADTVFLFCFPLCHVGGYVVMVNHLMACTVGLIRAYDNETFLRLVAEWRVTQTGLAPTMIAFLLRHPGIENHDFGSLQAIGYGASAIPAEVLRAGMEVFGCEFYQGMGMTELGGNVLHFGRADHRRAAAGETRLLAAAGQPMALSEIRVVDAFSRDVTPGEQGEMLVRGDQVMSGYWGEPELTAAAFDDGWLRTGDIVRRDGEGMVYIVDRMKDMVISGGENVASREVEDVLYRHPAVADAAVFGVPDERWGEAVHAAVVVRENRHLDEETLVAHCREQLGGFKVPRHIEFVGELPRNVAGKVLKRVLREQFAPRQEVS